MARVTVEDCLEKVPNRFALTILGSRRARALAEGRGDAQVECDNKEGVTALREISGGKVRFREDVDRALMEFIEEQRRQLRVTTTEHTFLEAATLRAFEDVDDDVSDEPEQDVAELPSDPERLNAAAKDGAASSGEDDSDDNSDDNNSESDNAEGGGDFEGSGPAFDDDMSGDDVDPDEIADEDE